jgi:valyl-tRNA synthetase
LQRLIRRVTELVEGYDYAAAKSEIEAFFWRELADNYLEMAKQRLYDPSDPAHTAARYTLDCLLHTLLKLLAPFLPFVTEEIYQGLFANRESSSDCQSELPADEEAQAGFHSIHLASWPLADPSLESDEAEAVGEALVQIATAARRYKSEHNLALGYELDRLQLSAEVPAMASTLKLAYADLMSVTRARQIEILPQAAAGFEKVGPDSGLSLKIEG